MKLRELQSAHEVEDSNAFYISFSDLMVILSVFFVMMLSVSRVDVGSFEKIKTGFTGSTKGTLVELASELQNIVEGDPGVPGVEVRMAEDGVRLDLDTAALFDTASAILKPGALEPLEPILQKVLKTKYEIDVEGHSDDRPFYRKGKEAGDVETNWSLSGRRASSVVYHLMKMGFDKSRVRIVGYAQTKPKVEIKSLRGSALENARSKNRRVSLLVR
ncbi:MAG: flagellar motor protein MotB [Oligoflexales bacterium]